MTENAPAHTPGPWNITRKGYGYVDIRTPHKTSAEPNGQHVATAYQGSSIDRKESEANARLIAAAPDLLAALQQMRRQFDTYRRSLVIKDLDTRQRWAHEQAAACAAADAAIARALTGDERDTGNSQDAPTPAPGTDATTADGRNRKALVEE